MKKNFNNNDSNNIFPLKQTDFQPKSTFDSTLSSLNEESHKFINKINYILNINQNINTMKENNIDLQNINEDIFPKERFEGNFNNVNEKGNKYSFNQINDITNSNSLEYIFSKTKEKIIKEDIPEMILYKYNYDIDFFKESLKEIEYESKWLYDYLNIGKVIKGNEDKEKEIMKYIKTLLVYHKVEKRDIPYIILKYEDQFSKYFTQNQIFELLSIYDVEYLRLQKKRKRIINIFNYIIKDEESNLSKTISDYLKKEYILEAKNEYELDLIETQLGILTYTNQSVEIDENYKKLINYNILSNSNIDFSVLNKIRDNKLNDILEKFCLSPEQVYHNLKVLKGELNEQMIEPPFANCSLGDICQKKISEISGKFTSPKEILRISFEYYILLLSSHPYIFKFIYDELYKICTLNTSPTDKGKEILNCLHPSYHCKRISQMPISSFFEEKNENIINIYTNEFGDLYLDIEKCENNGLIKCNIQTGINSLEYSLVIEQLVSLLTKAVNGTKEQNITEKINNPLIIKHIGARTVAVKNMIYLNNFFQAFFLNYIKKKLRNYSEKFIIKKISEEFFKLISRNYLDNVRLEEDSFVVSIVYNNQKKYFKVLCLDSNFRCLKSIMKLEYLWRNEKISEASLETTLKLSREVTEFQNLINKVKPRAIIIDVSNLECYKMINYIRNKFRDCDLVYSDYISKIYKLKIIEITDQQENKQAIDQVKFVIDPINQLMDLWNYKYEDNLLLNLTFHPQQVNIKDIALFNYALEMQIIQVLNSKGIYLKNLTKYSYNLFNFISGLGPCTSSLIIKNINNPFMIKNSLQQNNSNIYKSMSPFMIENSQLQNPKVYNLKRNEKYLGLVKAEVFFSMIKDSIYFKKNCLCNAIVINVDVKNQEVNCILLRDTNSIRGILKFCNIDPIIQDYQKFFYSQRIILCKIIDIKLRHHSYEILLSNNINDLISVKDFLTENQTNPKLFQRFTIDEEEDFKIKEIKRLKEIQQYDQDKQSKLLKYSLIDMENEQFLVNLNYINIKKFLERYKGSDYKIRPSFLGENHLILTFLVIDDIFLNFDIEIIKLELDNYKENNEKSYLVNYKIENLYFKSLNELVDTFALKMSKKIKEFKNIEFFRTPSEINKLFYQIFTVKSNKINEKSMNENKVELEYKNKTKDISIGFMRESPQFGILFTKSNDEYDYTIDFIKILYNGFLFHGKIFNSLYDLINFYRDVHNTNHYKNFLKRQFICNIHSQIEEIDEQYIDFEGIDPNIEKFNNYYIQTNEMKELKENLLITNPKNSNNDKNFIGKKRKQDFNINNAWNTANTNLESNNNMEIETENWTNNNDWADDNNQNKSSKKKKQFEGKKNSNVKNMEDIVWGKPYNIKNESNTFKENSNFANNVWTSSNNSKDDWNNTDKNDININSNNVNSAWGKSSSIENIAWGETWNNSNNIKTENNNINNSNDWTESSNNYNNNESSANNKNNKKKENKNYKKNNINNNNNNKNNNNRNNFNKKKNNKNNRQASNFSWIPSNDNTNINKDSSWNSTNDNNNNSSWNSPNNNNINNDLEWNSPNKNNATSNLGWNSLNNNNANNNSAWNSTNNNNVNSNFAWNSQINNNKNNNENNNSNKNNNSNSFGWDFSDEFNKKTNNSGWDSPSKYNNKNNNLSWDSSNKFNKTNNNFNMDSQTNNNKENGFDSSNNNTKNVASNFNWVNPSNNSNNQWGDSNNNNNNTWDNKNIGDSWENSNNTKGKDSWANQNNDNNNWADTNKDKNSFNKSNNRKNFNQNNLNSKSNSWNKGNKGNKNNKNFNKNNNKNYGNNNTPWNKNNNNQSNFNGWTSNTNNNNNNNENRKFNSSKGGNSWSKTKNDFNASYGKKNKNKKNKKSHKNKWSDILKEDEEKGDIKQEKDDDGEVINFNNEDMFGGYTLDKNQQ